MSAAARALLRLARCRGCGVWRILSDLPCGTCTHPGWSE